MRLLILVLGLALVCACDRQKPEAPQGNAAAPAVPEKGADRSQAGTPAPDVRFQGPSGEPATLADFASKPLLVNLWATWCAPCIKELPTLDALAAQGNWQVLTVSQDMGEQGKVRAFLRDRKLQRLEAWHDPEMALSSALGVQVLPTTILYDSAGKEVWRYSGDLDWTGEEAARLLAEGK